MTKPTEMSAGLSENRATSDKSITADWRRVTTTAARAPDALMKKWVGRLSAGIQTISLQLTIVD